MHTTLIERLRAAQGAGRRLTVYVVGDTIFAGNVVEVTGQTVTLDDNGDIITVVLGQVAAVEVPAEAVAF